MIRAYLEHYASNGLGPEGSCYGWIIPETSGTLRDSDDPLRFQFVRERHKELVLDGETRLYELCSELAATRPRSIEAFTKEELGRYLVERMDRRDPEWEAFLGGLTEKKRKKWEGWKSRGKPRADSRKAGSSAGRDPAGSVPKIPESEESIG